MPARSGRALGLLLGSVLDAAFADPRRGHPVAAFGRAATALERRIWADTRTRGIVHSGLCIGTAGLTGWLLERSTRGTRWYVPATAAATWAVLGGTTLAKEATTQQRLLEKAKPPTQQTPTSRSNTPNCDDPDRAQRPIRGNGTSPTDLPEPREAGGADRPESSGSRGEVLERGEGGGLEEAERPTQGEPTSRSDASNRSAGGGVERSNVCALSALAAARAHLASLCGRDPAGLGPAELARAAVESVAENTSDAVVAPLWWGALAGIPGLLTYRAVNTLDAMVGHRGPRYGRFGWAAARLDDLANLGPARLTGALAAALAPAVAGSPTAAWRTMAREGGAHPSPNAGRCEAAFAGALGLRLGGTNVYGTRIEHRGQLGSGRPPRPADIARAVRLSRLVAAAATALAALVAAGVARRGGGAR